MKKMMSFTLALLTLTSVVALAGPPKKDAKKAVKKSTTKTVKMVEVMHCPITGEAVADAKSKSAKVANYNVHFCCPGCPEQFAKMDKKTQLAKAKEASAKDVKTTPKKG
ncbi:MAG: hypothetical protein H7308_20275 [Chthonomonadaceae bacterium]|nr:hypothetical protein [Chthonomonadaceae bacterium]